MIQVNQVNLGITHSKNVTQCPVKTLLGKFESCINVSKKTKPNFILEIKELDLCIQILKRGTCLLVCYPRIAWMHEYKS
jgi:hypothetical protein